MPPADAPSPSPGPVPIAAPEPGRIIEIAPGVGWLRMPLPFALDHINLWVLDDCDDQGRDGVTLIDSGLSTDQTRALWEQVLQGPLKDKRVLRLICTHFHPDHMGLAGWLCQRLSIPLLTTLSEWALAVLLTTGPASWQDDIHGSFYRSHGLDNDACAVLRDHSLGYRDRADPPPARLHRLQDGDKITIGDAEWSVVVGHGHSPEMATLVCPSRRLFIAGDQVLPKITPNISVWPSEPEANPLRDYLVSLEQMRHKLPDDVLVLPSHRTPFHGLHARLAGLAAHHAQRLEAVLDACITPCTAHDILPVLFHRTLDHHQMSFAIGESLAHLHYHWRSGALQRFACDDGLIRFLCSSMKTTC